MAKRSNSASKYAEYTGLALLLPAGTFVGYLVGLELDKVFGTTWLRLVLLILGTIGGFVSLIRQIMRDSNDGGS